MKRPLIFTGFLFAAAGGSFSNSAVSELNGKFSAEQGNMDTEDLTTLQGSFTWPIQECFGIQLDGLYSNLGRGSYGYGGKGNADIGGIGGHFFWRDNEQALVGVTAGYIFSDPFDSFEIGLEAERYFKWFTLGGRAGMASVDTDVETPFIETDKDSFYCQIYLAIYPMENLRVSAMLENRFDNTFFGIEAEYQLPVAGLSIFGSALKGSHNFDQASIGLRYYFGADAPLKSRHRQSDPASHLSGMVSGVGTYQAEIHEQIAKNAAKYSVSPSGTTGGTSTLGNSSSGSSSSTHSLGDSGTLSFSGSVDSEFPLLSGLVGTTGGGSLGGSGTVGGTVQSGSATSPVTIGPGNSSGMTTSPLTVLLSPPAQPGFDEISGVANLDFNSHFDSSVSYEFHAGYSGIWVPFDFGQERIWVLDNQSSQP